ncbi:antitoxin [Singulisphaera acidiphila]|uniref:Late embryogenesis abundant protein n=1 Tax=Singulisphaera acidiphila (strain ATCC BAA-1392 / DSM 18658 / VKM B-2454 / MOB10) TaxID=886293 RepID=L0DB41_SINAD|nr:antitoxin [Singulisphaera acidiphila]AGA26063.1 Late embryogenesis abundant protein [Singulisphaera acidiphila DSM 18658]
MKSWLIRTVRASSLLFGTVVLFSGCGEPKGPAEQAGEKIDQGIQEAKDAVNPPSTGEKVGHAIDKAGENAANALDKAEDKASHALDKAGEKIEEGIHNAKDAINHPGTAEKAGQAVDKAVNP